MELSEKLQRLRSQHGLTQEQVATRLYVSRTAVSKWETGSGCPNLDSLVALARLYDVSVDDLLSGDEIIAMADDENRVNLKRNQCLVSGLLDIVVASFAFLPLYGVEEGDFVGAASLFGYFEATGFGVLYFAGIAALTGIGIIELLIALRGKRAAMQRISALSLVAHAMLIVLFALSRQPYATVLLFVLIAVKVVLLLAAHRDSSIR